MLFCVITDYGNLSTIALSVKDPVSVKERREHFLQGLGLVDSSSKVCSQQKMSLDDSSISLGLERIRECSGAISNACILHTDEVVSEKLILSGGKAGSKEKISLDEFTGCPQDEAEANIQGKEHELSYTAHEHRPKEGKNKIQRIKVKHNKKRCLEFSGLYLGQESTPSALGNDTDQLSSLRFKEAVENNPFNVLASWNSSTHFCKWHGVTCSLKPQRVSALNLQGYALRGLITPEIGNLTLDASSTVKVCVCINVLSSIANVPRNQVWLQEFV
ncbi:hypothetical protein JHK86_006487 [Glycine max]|nr:hypothetical protein JHK86_006487 [Glycine max]